MFSKKHWIPFSHSHCSNRIARAGLVFELAHPHFCHFERGRIAP
jgi:hypothetical protein